MQLGEKKTLHATNQPTTRPAATDEKKRYSQSDSRRNISHLWTDEQVGNMQAKRLPAAAQGAPANSTDLQKQSSRGVDT